jgi:hypothetical protein
LAIALALLSPACGEGGDGPVPATVLTACLRVEEPQEQVFRNAEDWQRFYSEHSEGGSAPTVDFGRASLAAHFDGTGSACASITLDTVAARDGSVTIDATRRTSPGPCIDVVAYPQLLVVVERRDVPVVFRIRDVTAAPPADHVPCV